MQDISRSRGAAWKRGRRLGIGASLLGGWLFSGCAWAESDIPQIDTEDAEIGSAPAEPGRVHVFSSVDVRNGDYARGAYDDDASNLRQAPFHVALGLAVELHRRLDEKADVYLLLESNNGIHRPRADEILAPRGWYESNNLIGLAARPVDGLTIALSYTNKRSPNGASDISHEMSLSAAFQGKSFLGNLNPTVTLTARPADGRGAYVQLGAEPQWRLGRSKQAVKLGLPIHIGMGWGGFYKGAAGAVTYGNVGLSLAKPFRAFGRRFSVRSELLAVIRDSKLRALDGANADRAAVVPLATLGVSTGF